MDLLVVVYPSILKILLHTKLYHYYIQQPEEKHILPLPSLPIQPR